MMRLPGYTSPSNLHRRAECPGSQVAESHYPFVEDSKFSSSGKLQHAEMWCHTNQEYPTLRDRLNADELRATQRAGHLVREYKKNSNFDALFGSEEVKIDGGEWNTVIDYLEVIGQRALVVDYKFGRGAVEAVESNLQMMAMAVAVWKKYEINEITVVVIQPSAEQQLTDAIYGATDLQNAEIYLKTIWENANTPNAPRIPGAHCKYCRHAGNCVEAAEEVKDLIQIGATQEAVARLDAGQLGLALHRFKIAEAIGEAVKEETRRRLHGGEEIPGFRLGKPKQYQNLRGVDTRKAYQLLLDSPLVQAPGTFTTGRFYQSISVSLPKLSEQVQEHLQIPLPKAKKALEEILGNLIIRTESIPSVEATPEALKLGKEARQKKLKPVSAGEV